MKNFFIFAQIPVIISSFYGFVLFSINSKKSKANRIFSLYTLCVFLWAVFYLCFINTADQNLSLIFMRTGVGVAVFIPSTFFHFTTHLINKYYDYKSQIILSYIFSFILYLTTFTPLFIYSAQPIPILSFYPTAGPTYIFLVLEYFLLIAYALILIKKESYISSKTKQRELNWIFWGILLAYTGGATNFPMVYNIPIYPIGNFFISLYMIFITYAILKYQSFDIKLIFKKSLVYTVIITFLTINYLIISLIIEHTFRETFGYKSIFLSLSVATIIGLLFIPIKNLLEKLIFKNSFIKIYEENQLLRSEVSQTERLKSIAILASGMAHEIKNPLTALKTISEYLPKKGHDPEFLKKFAPIMSHEVDRINNIVHELLEFAKPSPVQLKSTNLHQLLNSTLDLLNNNLIKHKIHLTKKYTAKENLMLNLDTNQFKQALLNILLNAIDVMPSGGELSISTNTNEDNNLIYIKIQDTGCGISQEDLKHIFDPFFTKKEQGTGLGLSITHEIIKNHNGKIFVESKINSGTTFIIELPYNSPLL